MNRTHAMMSWSKNRATAAPPSAEAELCCHLERLSARSGHGVAVAKNIGVDDIKILLRNDASATSQCSGKRGVLDGCDTSTPTYTGSKRNDSTNKSRS